MSLLTARIIIRSSNIDYFHCIYINEAVGEGLYEYIQKWFLWRVPIRLGPAKGKRSIIHQLFVEYDIQSAQDIQDALKYILDGAIKEMIREQKKALFVRVHS